MRCLRWCKPLLAMVLLAVAMLGWHTVGAANNDAALIVIKGDGTSIWIAVPFSEDEISGVELLDRSSLDVTTVSFGGLGIGVCGIEQTGCDVGECRKRLCQGPKREDPYWQYFLGQPDGTWTVAALGISGDSVANGEVRALIWSANPPSFAAPSLAAVTDKTGVPGTAGANLVRLNADGSLLQESESARSDQNTIAGVAVLAVFGAGIGAMAWRRGRRTRVT